MSNFATAADALRIDRNHLLAATDRYMIQDWPLTASQKTELLTYRQALRDLPSSVTPELDENYQLIGFEWPQKPSFI
jgi:hypothetical protein